MKFSIPNWEKIGDGMELNTETVRIHTGKFDYIDVRLKENKILIRSSNKALMVEPQSPNGVFISEGET